MIPKEGTASHQHGAVSHLRTKYFATLTPNAACNACNYGSVAFANAYYGYADTPSHGLGLIVGIFLGAGLGECLVQVMDESVILAFSFADRGRFRTLRENAVMNAA